MLKICGENGLDLSHFLKPRAVIYNSLGTTRNQGLQFLQYFHHRNEEISYAHTPPKY